MSNNHKFGKPIAVTFTIILIKNKLNLLYNAVSL